MYKTTAVIGSEISFHWEKRVYGPTYLPKPGIHRMGSWNSSLSYDLVFSLWYKNMVKDFLPWRSRKQISRPRSFGKNHSLTLELCQLVLELLYPQSVYYMKTSVQGLCPSQSFEIAISLPSCVIPVQTNIVKAIQREENVAYLKFLLEYYLSKAHKLY